MTTWQELKPRLIAAIKRGDRARNAKPAPRRWGRSAFRHRRKGRA